MNSIQAHGQVHFTIDFDHVADPVGLLQFLKLSSSLVQNQTVSDNPRSKSKGGVLVKKDPETKDKVLKLLAEKHYSSAFTVIEVTPLIKTTLHVSVNTLRRALKFGIEKGLLASDSRGVYRFLESATIQRAAPGSIR